MNLKCTAMPIKYMRDNFRDVAVITRPREVLKFKSFQETLTTNRNLSRPPSGFQCLSESWKM